MQLAASSHARVPATGLVVLWWCARENSGRNRLKAGPSSAEVPMARRKARKARPHVRQGRQSPVLMGDVRQAPIEICEGGRAFHPVIALWVRAEDGCVVGQLVDEPGHTAQTLVQALGVPVAGQPQTSARPSHVVVFNEELAEQMKPLLAPLEIEVTTEAPFKPFDDLFADLLAGLEQACQPWSAPDLTDEVMKPLISAAERLWRDKPWKYTLDYPPFAVVPGQGNGRPLYASILGADEEVFGIALYTSLADYEETVALGESTIGVPAEAVSPDARVAVEMDVLDVMRHQVFLVTFEPRNEVHPALREYLTSLGWPRRLGAVPTFVTVGGGEEPRILTAEEAAEVALGVDSLVTFCRRYRQRIADEEFPIHDTVEASLGEKTVRVDVSVPGEDPSAPPATVYRFKVSLTDQKGVWRTIDVRSDQTLEDLHYAIQDAFGWDDEHMYAFFLSGKAWDASTVYIRPEGRRPGEHSARVRLDRLGLRLHKRFLYLFDFGDEWRHEIRVEKVGLPPDGGEYPRIVDEHGQAPTQYGNGAEGE
jgi:hypothetical protein